MSRANLQGITCRAAHFTTRVPPPVSARISFTFELTPLKVEKKEQRAGTFLRFLTRSAAVVGGLFTVAGILDSAWYHSSKHLIKARLNKAS